MLENGIDKYNINVYNKEIMTTMGEMPKPQRDVIFRHPGEGTDVPVARFGEVVPRFEASATSVEVAPQPSDIPRHPETVSLSGLRHIVQSPQPRLETF